MSSVADWAWTISRILAEYMAELARLDALIDRHIV